jgi:D-alanyl-D-alanine carboxypeptidase
MTKLKTILLVAVVLVAAAGALWATHDSGKPAASKSSATTPATNKKPSTSSFNKKQYSLTDPTSMWVVVNKQNPLLPKDYAPKDLVVPNVPLRVPGNESMQVRQATATALETMFTAAKTDNISLMLSSGYRSYTYQVSLYNSYVSASGQSSADQESARPGYSEHQTGLAADIEGTDKTCEVEQCWATTPEGKWLAANAYKYGFIIRYTSDKVSTTGYEYEPWHVRYVGTALSTELHRQNIETLEEFFGVTGGATYAP